MPTINVNRQGHIQGITSGNFNTARTSESGLLSVTDGITGQKPVQYFHSVRGKRFNRAFLHFDTSGITAVSYTHLTLPTTPYV